MPRNPRPFLNPCPVEEAIVALLNSIGTAWRPVQWDALSQAEQGAASMLIRGDYVEARAAAHITVKGQPAPFTVQATVGGNFVEKLKYETVRLARAWAGELPARALFKVVFRELRLTAAGEILSRDMDALPDCRVQMAGEIVSAEPRGGRCVIDAYQQPAAPPPAPAAATHSADFTTVDWWGKRYTFDDGHQAKAIGLLWAEYEAGGHGLSEKTIGEKIGSANDDYRLRHTFRDHPAFGTMIQRMQRGVYCLRKPESRQNPG